MKFWILAIFLLEKKIEELAQRYEKRIMSLALDLKTETNKLYNMIVSLNDKKHRVINLRVLYNIMIENLSDSEKELIRDYCSGSGIDAIASKFMIARSTVNRRLNRLLTKCINCIARLGYNENKMQKDYNDIELILMTVSRLKKRSENACGKNQD